MEDIFASDEAGDDCCDDCGNAYVDNAMDSTFISNLPEPDHSYEVAPFDCTLDNMSLLEGAGELHQKQQASILPRLKTSRSRFVSEDNGCQWPRHIPDKEEPAD